MQSLPAVAFGLDADAQPLIRLLEGFFGVVSTACDAGQMFPLDAAFETRQIRETDQGVDINSLEIRFSTSRPRSVARMNPRFVESIKPAFFM